MISPPNYYTISLLFFLFNPWYFHLSGVELMEAFKRELSIYEKDRQELANAEKLFDLSITMYPELLQVQKEMTGLDKIYEIYKQQKVSARMGFLRGFS